MPVEWPVTLNEFGDELTQAKEKLLKGEFSKEQFDDLGFRYQQVVHTLESMFQEVEEAYDVAFPPG